ncbi:MAG TPA: alpha/beta hydrolase [Actinomycetota bacterium]|nr:alpha/beta hydrolase [Actinomycetota bacterium]
MAGLLALAIATPQAMLGSHDPHRSQPMSGVAPSRDGIPLAFEVHGAGTPALVFVHGWSCDRSYWRRQLGPLAAQYQTVAVDLAGHGESGVGRRAWTMAAFGEDVVAVVEQLGLGELVLVGHSMGGDVIVEAALRLGGQVAGLVWVDTYSTLGEPPTDDEIEAFLAPFREDFVTATRALVGRLFTPDADAELVEWVASDMSAAPPEIAVDALGHAVGNERGILAGLRQLRAPVVAINPDARPTDAEALRRHGVRAVLMSGVGHFLMLEDPDRFNRQLGEVIETFRG